MAAKQKSKPIAPKDPDLQRAAVAPVEGVSRVSLLPGAVGLKLLVFIAGAVLMGLEIVGSRILAPYFGNSVFVWGSLISLFLIALSVGYYVGGRWADRRPSQRLLNSIMAAVAAWLFFIAAAGDPICNWILQRGYGEKAGPFLASVLLFLLPSVGMGVASPFAVKLATSTVASVGKTAGTLYALSTIGSIVGTLLTTFVLIPALGADAILKGLAAVLLLASIITFPFASVRSAAVTALLAIVLASAGAAFIHSSDAALPLGSHLLADVDTPYHHISVIEEGPSRQLRFDRFVESAIESEPPYRSLSVYTTYFHLALLPQPKIRRALFIGAGGGVGPRAFHQHDPEMQIDVVDIDAKVLQIAYDYFRLPRTPKIVTAAADGRTFVRNAEDGSYDCIILDAFTIGGRIPFHLVTQEFFDLCRKKLAPGGVFVMNINSATAGDAAQIFRSMYKTIASVFPRNTYAFAINRHQARPEQTTNVILVATLRDRPIAREEWTSLAGQYDSKSYVDRSFVERMVVDLVTTVPDLDKAVLFTDDYAPIETMSFESD